MLACGAGCHTALVLEEVLTLVECKSCVSSCTRPNVGSVITVQPESATGDDGVQLRPARNAGGCSAPSHGNDSLRDAPNPAPVHRECKDDNA